MSSEPIEPLADASIADAAAAEPVEQPPGRPSAFDLKETTKEQRQDGAGFNQFDPVLTASRFISRR